MNETSPKPTRVTEIAAAGALLAAVGGALFWAWRERAPLSRLYRQRKNRREGDRPESKPDPEANAGTRPV